MKKESSEKAESFIGYGLILLGLFMASGHDISRIITCLLAGSLWLKQAFARRHLHHYHIALMFFVLAIASVGLIDQFPNTLLAGLGIIAILFLNWASSSARKHQYFQLVRACKNTQIILLFLSIGITILSQWHYSTPPLISAVYLIVLSLILVWRAHDDNQIKWLHIAMISFALVLPYLGCVDLETRSLQGNTLIFGIALLSSAWILLVKFSKHHLLKEARSSVLWLYGFLAVIAMISRVILERDAGLNPLWYLQFMDYGGPMLMTAILILTSYYSRSLLPAFMASIIAIILFPELKANFRATMELVGFGSGLGSVCCTALFVGFSFYLRKSVKLKSLGEGDRFMSNHSFPLLRHDHTLFTWPLMISSGFLLIKTGTYNLVRQIRFDDVSFKSALALMIMGAVILAISIYYRRHGKYWLLHLSWIYFLIGLILFSGQMGQAPHWSVIPIVLIATLQALFFISRHYLKNHDWLQKTILNPTQHALSLISSIASLMTIFALFSESSQLTLLPISLVCAAQLIWHGLRSKRTHFGLNLFLLAWAHILVLANGTTRALSFSLIYLLLVLIIHCLSETKAMLYDKFRPLLRPWLYASTLSSLVFTYFAFAQSLHHHFNNGLLFTHLYIIVGLLALLTRIHNSKFFALTLISLVYSIFHKQFSLDLLSPWHLSLLALAFTSMGLIYCCPYGSTSSGPAPNPVRDASLNWQLKSLWFRGSQPIRWLQSLSIEWLFTPALVLVILTEFAHLSSDFRNSGIQIFSSLIACACFTLIGHFNKRPQLFGGSLLFLGLTNIHFFRVFCGDFLRANGLSENHLIALGLGLTLVMLSGLKKAISLPSLKHYFNRAGLIIAMGLLVILMTNYFTAHKLENITYLRFLISGIMALVAALYFRNISRFHLNDQDARLCETFYHAGLSIAFWCATLILPFMRQPATALFALALPALYFYVRAEFSFQLKESSLYKGSASTLCYLLLALYACRPFFQMILFPDQVINSDFFHTNAPLIFLIGLILFRLKAFGCKTWTAFYGGLALVLGAYFSIAAFPRLSPFTHQVNAAWLAVLSAHFWIVINHARSPIKSFMQSFASLNDKQWNILRLSWGHCLFVASQLVVAMVLFQYDQFNLAFAPLLVGAGTIALHLGLIRNSKFYLKFAGLQFFIALHTGYVIDSYLPNQSIIWVILIIWGAVLLIHNYSMGKVDSVRVRKLSIDFMLTSVINLLYISPFSSDGLIALAVIALFAGLIPVTSTSLKSWSQKTACHLLISMPAILSFCYFFDKPVSPVSTSTATCFTLFLIVLALYYFKYLIHRPEVSSSEPRFYDLLNQWISLNQIELFTLYLWATSIAALSIVISSYNEALSVPNLILCLLLSGGLAASWFQAGQLLKSQRSFRMMLLFGFGLFAIIRHQLIYTSELWSVQYDIWFCLIIALIISGAKAYIAKLQEELQVPLLSCLFLLPCFSLSWTIYHNLSMDSILMILGIHSLIFSFMGAGNKKSIYNFMAVIGFVAFTIIALINKVDIQTTHVYILPTGIGVLALLQLFHDQVEAETRQVIRLITLVIMVATCAYYALIANPHSIGFNITMLGLCLAAMLFGSFFKIRLYLTLGFAGLMVNLASIIFRAVADMDKGARITIMGTSILIIGGALVFGALYYKTHQEKISVRIQKLRAAFGVWE